MIIRALLRCAAIARSLPAQIGAAVLVAILFVFQTTRFRLKNLKLTADASIVYEKSRTIWQTAAYPARLALGNFNEVFPYPPPAVLLFSVLGHLSPAVFHVTWLLMMAAGLVATFRCLVVYEDAEIRSAFIALMLPTIGLVSNPIIHDLSNLNNNLIILGLAMAAYALMARHPLCAGALLAVPIALKLYLGAILLWVVVYRPRAVVSCGAGLVLLGGLPIAIFGLDGAAMLYRGWFDQIAIVNGAWVYALTPETGGPPLITLRRAAAYLTGTEPFGAETQIVLRTMQGFWIATVSGYLLRAWKLPKAAIGSRAALADWSVLFLAPLPFSPWLEPHHGVPLILPVAIFLLALFDRGTERNARRMAGGTIASIVVIQLWPAPFEVRGLIYLMQFIVCTIFLSAMRSDLMQIAQPARSREANIAEGPLAANP